MLPWIARRWYDFAYFACTGWASIMHGLRVAGTANIPRTGPVMLLSNHQSFMDPPLVGLGANRYLSYLARRTLFRNPRFKAFIESLDAIPIDHKGFSKEGIQIVLDKLDKNCAILMFPEGERTHDGEVHPIKPGISLILRRSKAPIVPVGIAGAYYALNRFMKIPRLAPIFLPWCSARIAVCYGKAIYPHEIEHMGREELLDFLHKKMVEQFERAKMLQLGVQKQFLEQE
ncbi:MAG: lysophospholipid acyltransferase family protein [Zavarzinella sp.]